MPYFKRVLIPFGEYMPMASYFPWLGELNAKAGVFGAGTETKVFELPDATRRRLGLYPEGLAADLLRGHRAGPRPRGDAKGAELLVNITSDAWFGRSLGPSPASPDRRLPRHREPALSDPVDDHRADSAIVDPLGRTIARIPPFSEGTATARVDSPGLSQPIHHMGRRPALVGPPHGQPRHDRRQALSDLSGSRTQSDGMLIA